MGMMDDFWDKGTSVKKSVRPTSIENLDTCKESVSGTITDFVHFNVRLGKNL